MQPPKKMKTFKIVNERHTLASALRPNLESLCGDEEFVSCTLMHPMDNHIEVIVPQEQLLRTALLLIKDQIRQARHQCKMTVCKISTDFAAPA